jgi:hypothetical protein
VSQICLDYFWFQEGYWADKVFKPSFFHNSLPILTDLLSPNGAIYTAFVADIFIQVVIHESSFKEHLKLSLVHERDVGEIDLVEGSHGIPDELYGDEKIFGRKDQKPEIQFGFGNNALGQKEVTGTDVKQILRRYKQLMESYNEKENLLSYRFLKLTKI